MSNALKQASIPPPGLSPPPPPEEPSSAMLEKFSRLDLISLLALGSQSADCRCVFQLPLPSLLPPCFLRNFPGWPRSSRKEEEQETPVSSVAAVVLFLLAAKPTGQGTESIVLLVVVVVTTFIFLS